MAKTGFGGLLMLIIGIYSAGVLMPDAIANFLNGTKWGLVVGDPLYPFVTIVAPLVIIVVMLATIAKDAGYDLL